MGDPGTTAEAVAAAIPTAKHTVLNGAIFRKKELSGMLAAEDREEVGWEGKRRESELREIDGERLKPSIFFAAHQSTSTEIC